MLLKQQAHVRAAKPARIRQSDAQTRSAVCAGRPSDAVRAVRTRVHNLKATLRCNLGNARIHDVRVKRARNHAVVHRERSECRLNRASRWPVAAFVAPT